MRDCAPLELKLLKIPAYVHENHVASGFLDIDAYLWQEGPVVDKVTLSNRADEPMLEIAVSCHYDPPAGCRHMAARSSTKVTQHLVQELHTSYISVSVNVADRAFSMLSCSMIGFQPPGPLFICLGCKSMQLSAYC